MIRIDYWESKTNYGLTNSDWTYNVHNIVTLDDLINDFITIDSLLKNHNLSIEEIKLSGIIMQSKNSLEPVKRLLWITIK